MPHHQVLVKVLACGVCHSDTAAGQGVFGNSFPIIPGHEVIGEVAAVPESEKRWKEGDRVGGPWHGGHDGTCRQCKSGLFQMCDNEQVNGVTRNGGYGEYVTLRTEVSLSSASCLAARTCGCGGVWLLMLMILAFFPPPHLLVFWLPGSCHLAVSADRI